MNEPTTPAPRHRHEGNRKFFSLLQRYRSMLQRSWWVLIIAVILAVAVESWIIRQAPPLFLSVGQMIVNVKINIKENSLYTEELGNFLGTQQALMQGQQVVGRARERLATEFPNITAPPSVKLEVNLLPKTTIFVLRATGGNPEYTKAYLQACMEEFQQIKRGVEKRASDVTIAGLTDQMLRLQPDMRKVDDEVAAFLSTNDVGLAQEANGVANYMSSLYQQLAEARSEFSLLESMSLDQSLLIERDRTPANSLLGGRLAGEDKSVLASAAAAGQSTLVAPSTIGMEYLSIKQRILLLKAEIDRYGEYLKPMHPKMVELGDQLNRLNQMLGIYKDQTIEQLEARKTALDLKIKNLEAATKKLGEQKVELDRKNAQYNRLKAKGDRLQDLYNQLLATLQTLDVNKDIGPESVTIYQAASDAYAVNPEMTKKLVVAGIVGLALGLGILLLLNRLDDRMTSFLELEELFDEDILGQIPREGASIKQGSVPLLKAEDARHPFVEAYRNLRSSLLYTAEIGKRPHTLLITSSVPNDGKSVTAANLAITLANGGARVLLVDADLRKGNQHRRFGIQVGIGLSECLTKNLDWRQAVSETTTPNLHLLQRGEVIHHSSEYFIGPAMQEFLEQTIKQYDYVLIDTVPVMAADDVTSLAPRVDGVIFVVRAEFTSARVAHASLDMLAQRRANILGLVFNAVRPSAGEYYSYYRYRDYYATHPTK